MVTITTSPGAAIASGTCAPETEGIDTEKRHATTMPVGAGGFIVDLHLWVVRNFGPSIKSPSKIGQRFGVASAPLWDVLSSWATTDDQGCRQVRRGFNSCFILPYEGVREARDPDELLLGFLQETHGAAASLAAWDGRSIERAAESRR